MKKSDIQKIRDHAAEQRIYPRSFTLIPPWLADIARRRFGSLPKGLIECEKPFAGTEK